MNSAFGLSVSFVSRVRSKCIGHNTCTYRRSNLCSKPAPIYGLVQKVDFILIIEEKIVDYHRHFANKLSMVCLSRVAMNIWLLI